MVTFNYKTPPIPIAGAITWGWVSLWRSAETQGLFVAIMKAREDQLLASPWGSTCAQ